jgi:hypothetical protein
MRDLRHFLDAGYVLRAVQPFDLFPQTRHLECIITLERGASAGMPASLAQSQTTSPTPPAAPTAGSTSQPNL